MIAKRCTLPADLALVSKVGARRDDTGAWLPAQTRRAARQPRGEPERHWDRRLPRSTFGVQAPMTIPASRRGRPRAVRTASCTMIKAREKDSSQA